MSLGENLLESILYHMVQLHNVPSAAFAVRNLLPIMHAMIGYCPMSLRLFLVCIAYSDMLLIEAIAI